MLPNFLGIGAAKAGTTTLHMLLIQHPEIFLPRTKEVHFFCHEQPHYGSPLSRYELQHFDEANHKAVGEISPSYIASKYAVEQVYDMLGDQTKIIVCLRNPMDRAFSHYHMNQSEMIEKLSFEDALSQKQTEQRSKERAGGVSDFCYVDNSLYAHQMEMWFKKLPQENFFFIVMEEDFAPEKIEQTTRNLFKFLNVDPDFKVNTKIPMNKSRDMIVKYYSDGSVPLKDRFITSVFAKLDQYLPRSVRMYVPMALKNFIKKLLAKKNNNQSLAVNDSDFAAGDAANEGPIYIHTRYNLPKIMKNPSQSFRDDVQHFHSMRISKPEVSVYQKLAQNYFLQDVLKLEKMIDRDLSIWTDKFGHNRHGKKAA